MATTPNIVVLVLDDCGANLWGPNRSASYVGLTPDIDKTLSEGVYFSNCWGLPNCGPARTAALVGRFGARTGMQSSIQLPGNAATYAQAGAQWQLQAGETTIAHRVKKLGYKTACFGKWHINAPGSASDWDAPRTIGGFDHYAGYPGNMPTTNTGANSTPDPMSVLYNAALPAAERLGWARIVNNVLTPVGTPRPGDLTHSGGSQYTGGYAPSVNIDDAISWANANSSSPRFIWLAPQAPHTPLQWPPYALHSQTMNYPGGYTLTGPMLEGEFFSAVDPTHPLAVKPFMKASLQALNTEFARLRAVMPANTFYIVFGDNGTDGLTEVGTDGSLVESPANTTHGKNTMYEDGIRVPLAISGPGIWSPGRVVDCPVALVDIYETCNHLAGLAYDLTKTHDSKPLIPFLHEADCHSLFGITPGLRGQQVSSIVAPVVNPALYSSTTFTKRWYAAKVSGYKLIWKLVGGTPGQELYYLPNDPLEATNLIGTTLSETAKQHKKLCEDIIRGYISGLEGLPPPNNI